MLVCPRSAEAEVVTLLKGPVWEATIEQDIFCGLIGHTEAVTLAGARTREFAFFLNTKERRFGVFVAKENIRAAQGSLVPVTFTFQSAQASKPLAPLRITGRVKSGQVMAMLSDAEVAVWTHNITAGSAMTVSLPTQDNEQWTFDLAGTTPAVTAMAAAIGAAAVPGLPLPWRTEGTSAVKAPDDIRRVPSGVDPNEVEMQKRQLAIARADADKARADAERAQADAVKAQADAERARAEALVIADAKARASEEARAVALRLAAEERRQADQAKAERDAKGVEP